MNPEKATILVVDDEPSITDMLARDLAEEGYNCITSASGEDALMKLYMDNVDAVLLDLKLPGISGIDVLKEMKSTCPETAAIVVTAAVDAQTAVEAMKIGAIDYITKPFELAKVNKSIEAALQAKPSRSSSPIAEDEGAEAADEEVDWTHYMDSIACGVRTRLDSLNGHLTTRIIVDRTIAIARGMDIPDKYIAIWETSERKYIEQSCFLDSLLKKLELNPVTLSI